MQHIITERLLELIYIEPSSNRCPQSEASVDFQKKNLHFPHKTTYIYITHILSMKQLLFTVFLFFSLFVAYAGGNGNVSVQGGGNPTISAPKPTTSAPKWVDKILESRVGKQVLKTLEDISYAKKLAGQSLGYAFGGMAINLISNLLFRSIGLPYVAIFLFSIFALTAFLLAIVIGGKALRQYKLQDDQIGRGSAVAGSIIGWICFILGAIGLLIFLKLMGII